MSWSITNHIDLLFPKDQDNDPDNNDFFPETDKYLVFFNGTSMNLLIISQISLKIILVKPEGGVSLMNGTINWGLNWKTALRRMLQIHQCSIA